jgi:hypothetical protein
MVINTDAELKKRFLELLKSDEEFRLAAAGLLGLDTVISELKMLREGFLTFVKEQERMWEENNRRWESAYKRFEAIEKKLLEHDAILKEHGKRLEEMGKAIARIDAMIGRFSGRWGRDF